MIKRISKTHTIKAKMKKEGKMSYLDQPKHFDAIVKMNDGLEEVRRDYQIKDKKSQISASSVVLTA